MLSLSLLSYILIDHPNENVSEKKKVILSILHILSSNSHNVTCSSHFPNMFNHILYHISSPNGTNRSFEVTNQMIVYGKYSFRYELSFMFEGTPMISYLFYKIHKD